MVKFMPKLKTAHPATYRASAPVALGTSFFQQNTRAITAKFPTNRNVKSSNGGICPRSACTHPALSITPTELIAAKQNPNMSFLALVSEISFSSLFLSDSTSCFRGSVSSKLSHGSFFSDVSAIVTKNYESFASLAQFDSTTALKYKIFVSSSPKNKQTRCGKTKLWLLGQILLFLEHSVAQGNFQLLKWNGTHALFCNVWPFPCWLLVAYTTFLWQDLNLTRHSNITNCLTRFARQE